MNSSRSQAIDNLLSKPQIKTVLPIDINLNAKDKGVYKDHLL